MRITSSNRNLFILAFFILFSVNLVVLLGVLANRSGNPDFKGFVTEREMKLLRRMHNENSGLSLKIMWRTVVNRSYTDYYSSIGFPGWLNARKLKELGFKINSKNVPYRYKNQLPKEVYVVLEYNGDSYKNSLINAENEFLQSEKNLQISPEDKEIIRKFKRAKKNLAEEKYTKSKLFAIDVGLDHTQLRNKYSDRSKFIITRAVVRPLFYAKKNSIVGYITKLSIERVHVPLKFKMDLESFVNTQMTQKNDIPPPKYQVELVYGNKLEPYIASVKPLKGTLQN